jgi:hypothetical protein
MNRGWGQAPRDPEAPTGDLARHHEQAPPGPHQTRLHAVGNKTRLTNYVETRTEQAPQPLTKTTYGGVCTRHAAYARTDVVARGTPSPLPDQLRAAFGDGVHGGHRVVGPPTIRSSNGANKETLPLSEAERDLLAEWLNRLAETARLRRTPSVRASRAARSVRWPQTASTPAARSMRRRTL